MAEGGFTAGFPAMEPACLESFRWMARFSFMQITGCGCTRRFAPPERGFILMSVTLSITVRLWRWALTVQLSRG